MNFALIPAKTIFIIASFLTNYCSIVAQILKKENNLGRLLLFQRKRAPVTELPSFIQTLSILLERGPIV